MSSASDAKTLASHSSDSDSEAPEDVSFSTSKTAALEVAKAVKDSKQQQSDKLKLKRQRRQELLEQQKLAKKKRLDDLASKTLSDDVLESVSNIEQFRDRKAKQLLSAVECLPSKTDNKTSEEERESPKISRRISNSVPVQEYIPLESSATEFRVKVIKGQPTGTVANFEKLLALKNTLINGPNRKRISTKDMKLLRSKSLLYKRKAM